MRVRALPLLVLLVAAGCVAPAAPEPEAGTPAGAMISFLPPVVVAPKPNVQQESFLALGPDGRTILICLHGDFRAPPPLYASQDGGVTWAAVEVEGLVASGDCDVAMGPDRAWHVLATLLAGAGVASSADDGATWASSHLAAPPTNGGVDRPWLEATDAGLFLTYKPLFLGPGIVAFTKSSDGGRTWSAPTHLTQPERDFTHVSQGPFLASDGGQTLRVPILRHEWPPSERVRFEMAVSRDAGETWTLQPVGEPREAILAAPVSVARAWDGTLFWAYTVPNGSEVDMLVTLSRDDGASWSSPVRVLGGWPACDGACSYVASPIGIPWMDGGPGATAALAFVEEGRLVVARLDADAPGLLVGRADVGAASPIEFLEIEQDGLGRAHVAWTHDGKLWHVREADAAQP